MSAIYYDPGTTGDGSVWRYWAASATTATTAAYSDTTWRHWTNQDTSAMTTASTWTTWASTTSGVYTVKAQSAPAQTPTVESIAEYNRRQAVQLAESMRLHKEREAKHLAAKARAEQTLCEHLTEEQEKAWKENRAIFVTSQSGRRFKIKEGRAHNIYELNEHGEAIREYCVHVEPYIPDADNVLAQKLALQHNEDALLRLANKWDL